MLCCEIDGNCTTLDSVGGLNKTVKIIVLDMSRRSTSTRISQNRNYSRCAMGNVESFSQRKVRQFLLVVDNKYFQPGFAVIYVSFYSLQKFDWEFVTQNKFLCLFRNALISAFGSVRFYSVVARCLANLRAILAWNVISKICCHSW